MTRMITVAVLLCAVCTVQAESKYKEVEYDVFRVAPESFKSKDITYKVPFVRLSSTLLPYMEKSGLRADRYLWLLTGDQLVPVIIKKTDELVERVAAFKRGDILTVAGEVRKFREVPHQTVFSQYYLLADSIEVTVPALKDTREPPAPRRPRRPWAPRR